MENPGGTTEQPLSLADRMYSTVEAEPVEDNSQSDDVPETAEQEVEAESTDEVDSESVEDATDTETEEAEAEADEMFVTADGEEVSLKSLFDAYKGRKAAQADYTKKTTAAAEEMKRAEVVKAESEALRDSISPKLQMLRDIENGVGELILGDFAQINWNELRDSDPSQYLALKEAKESREKAIEQLKAKRDQLEAEQAQGEAQKLHDLLGWSDPAKRDLDVKAIEEGVKAANVSNEAFRRVNDAGLMSLILDGINHRKLQEKKPEIVRKVKSAPKVVSKPAKQAEPAKELSLADRMYRKKA